MSDEYFMGQAIAEAEKSVAGGDFGIGAVIVMGEAIIGRGHNRVKSAKNRRKHAEMDAMDSANAMLYLAEGQKVTLYSTYRPCAMCFGGMLLSGISRIVWGIDIDKSGFDDKDKLPECFQQERYKTEQAGGVLEKECLEVFMRSRLYSKLLEYDRIDIQERDRILRT